MFDKPHANTGKNEKLIRLFGHFIIFNIAEEKPRRWVAVSESRDEKTTFLFFIGKVEKERDGVKITMVKFILGPVVICIAK